eukprot:gene12780-16037_t
MLTLSNRCARPNGSVQKSSSVRVKVAPVCPSRDRRLAVRVQNQADKAPAKGTQGLGGFFSSLGTTKLGGAKQPSAFKGARSSDTIFVAGSTGRLGARIVRELLAAGYKVRAGARDVESAQKNVDIGVTYGLLQPDAMKRLQIVPFDLKDTDGMSTAIGNASRVVCAVGAAESEVLNRDGPKSVDGEGSIALVNAAKATGVTQFVLVTSLGTGKLGFPAGVLNLFWGVLSWKRKAEEALEASGMSYTIVRPGGMERPKDDFKETNNMVLSPRDTTFGGLVSRLQVAELVASILDNPAAAENKVVEVTAETTAALTSYADLLEGIKADLTKEEQIALAASADDARAKEAEAKSAFESAKAALEDATSRVEELSERLKTFKAQESEVKKSAAEFLKGADASEKELDAAKAKAEKVALAEKAAMAVLAEARKAASAGEVLSSKEQQQIFKDVMNPPRASPKGAAPGSVKTSGSGTFGSGFSSLFGSSVEKAPMEEEAVEEPKKEEPKKAAPGFMNMFAPPTPAKVKVEEKVVEKVEKVVEKVEKKAEEKGNIFSMFGAKAIDAESAAPPPPPAAAKAAPPPPAAAKKAPVAEAPKKAEPAPSQEKPKAAGFWGGLFGGGEAITLGDEDVKIQVDAPKEAPKPQAAAPTPAAPKPPAPAPVPAAPKPPPAPKAAAPPPPPPTAAKKSSAPTESDDDIVSRVMAQSRAVNEVKPAAPKVAPPMPAAAAKEAPPPPVAAAPKAAPVKPAAAAPPAAPGKPAAAAPTPAPVKPAAAPPTAAPAKPAAAVTDPAAVAASGKAKKEAQEWIADWKKKMAEPEAKPAQKMVAKSEEPKAGGFVAGMANFFGWGQAITLDMEEEEPSSPEPAEAAVVAKAPAAAAADPGASDPTAAKKEAQEWIAAWKKNVAAEK